MAKKSTIKSRPQASRRKKKSVPKDERHIVANPFRSGTHVHTLYERLQAGKPVSELDLFRGIETKDKNSLLQDMRRRHMVIKFDRQAKSYQLTQVGCIVLTPTQ